jgi:hypothetical protein
MRNILALFVILGLLISLSGCTPKDPLGREWVKALDGPFTPRVQSASAIFSDRLWLVAGQGPQKQYLRDVWYSRDGFYWERSGDGPFTPRFGHGLAAVGDKLFLVAGYDDTLRPKADVWVTEDGRAWTLVNPSAPFGPRVGAAVFAWQGSTRSFNIRATSGGRRTDANGAWRPTLPGLLPERNALGASSATGCS